MSGNLPIGNLDDMADQNILDGAATALETAQGVLDAAIARLAADGIDDNQVLAYDVAHAAAGVMASRALLEYGAKGDVEARITARLPVSNPSGPLAV